ncbi:MULTISPECIES: diguanylate cyclase domain-containing protein [Candidatus Ichthyocystis]|uniref:Putative sensor-regulator, GGDEF /PAS domain n=1 Tax=Candidatus Ichthyocystis hellenicum TaxID=1561003 RepID=A0A0S4LZV1_9BURK|nr:MULTISPECIES: diguanylate cyclase [Ichthyocystis]CUT17022.1 putative sensor-regulator, GGDEF /PAS domain [Candidatus Ichthyocystis hellenicum]
MHSQSNISYVDRMVYLDRLLQTGQLVSTSWFITVPLIIGMCIPMLESNHKISVLSWVVLAILLATARVFVAISLKRCTLESNLQRFEVVHSVVGMVSALAISLGLVKFSAILPISWQMMYTSISAVLAMGTAFTLLYTAMGFFFYMPSVVLPIGIAQIFHPDKAVRALGVMSIIMVPILAVYYLRQYKVVAKGMRVFYENKALFERQKSIFDAAPNGIIVSRKGIIVNANDYVSRMFGYEMSEIIGKNIDKLFLDSDVLHKLYSAMIKFSDDRRSNQETMEVEAVYSDGRNFWVGVVCSPIKDLGAKEEEGIVWIISDLTERMIVEDRVRKQQAMYQGLVEASKDLVFYLDNDFCFAYANPRGSMRVLGRYSDDLIGSYVGDIINHDGENSFDENVLTKVIELGTMFEQEVNMLHPDGDVKLIKLSLSPIRSLDGALMGIAGMATDITPSKEIEDHMLYLAMHDELTGLPNRRLFTDRLQQAIRQFDRYDGELAVLMLDLDRFKLVNDTLGHSVGDRVLEMTAYRLRSVLRASDTVARLGGDEFIILLPSILNVDHVKDVAQKVVDSVGEPLMISGQHVQIYASVGVSLYPRDGSTAEVLVGVADEAMYKSKQSGCNCYTMYSEMTKDKKPKLDDVAKRGFDGDVENFGDRKQQSESAC